MMRLSATTAALACAGLGLAAAGVAARDAGERVAPAAESVADASAAPIRPAPKNRRRAPASPGAVLDRPDLDADDPTDPRSGRNLRRGD